MAGLGKGEEMKVQRKCSSCQEEEKIGRKEKEMISLKADEKLVRKAEEKLVRKEEEKLARKEDENRFCGITAACRQTMLSQSPEENLQYLPDCPARSRNDGRP